MHRMAPQRPPFGGQSRQRNASAAWEWEGLAAGKHADKIWPHFDLLEAAGTGLLDVVGPGTTA